MSRAAARHRLQHLELEQTRILKKFPELQPRVIGRARAVRTAAAPPTTDLAFRLLPAGHKVH
jgi:hypothetical protein